MYFRYKLEVRTEFCHPLVNCSEMFLILGLGRDMCQADRVDGPRQIDVTAFLIHHCFSIGRKRRRSGVERSRA